MRRWSLVLPAVLLAACSTVESNGPGGGVLPAPSGLSYQVTSGGPGSAPVATLLRWNDNTDPRLASWNVYSRATTSGAWKLRGTTTSPSFSDAGVPELQYYVTAVDNGGFESPGSAVVTVDERLQLPAPAALTTTSLDGAIALSWSDNPFQSDPQGFKAYHVYSTTYDLDRDQCGATWALEGTTVAPEFVAGALVNGQPRCFGVSAVSIEGFESLWSPVRDDTPRPDARNVVVYAAQAQAAQSGFRFWRDLNGDGQVQPAELGLVGANDANVADFVVTRDGAGNLFLAPARTGTQVRVYGTAPVPDLTSIDVAPVGGYSTLAAQALPGWGYVFQMPGGDGFLRYGAVRVTHVGRDFLILDWSYQTDPGNPQLIVAR